MMVVDAPIISVSPAPPAVPVSADEFVPELVDFRASPVRCADEVVPFARRIIPFVAPLGQFPGRPSGAPDPITLRFRIDETGRPLSITRQASIERSGRYLDTSDLEPSLAASRFDPKRRDACEITYQPVVTPLGAAGPDLLFSAFDSPLVRPILPRVYARFAPAGSDCALASLRPRLLAFPDLDRFQGRPERHGALFSFDVLADGRTANVRLLRSYEAESARDVRWAVEQTRYVPNKPARGCVIGFTVGAAQPEGEQLRPGDASAPVATCPHLPLPVRRIEPGPFPPAFAWRNVEGYAVVRYDVATWGAVGNVRVETSEPAELFGQRAAAAVRALSFPPSAGGKKDCTTRILFRLGD